MSRTLSTPPRGPRPTRVEPECILEAAEQIFETHSLKTASVRAIARRAECDPALIYYHFKNKEAIFMALVDRAIPPLTEDLKRLADPQDRRPASLRLWDVLRVYRAHTGHHVGLRNVVRGELARGIEGMQMHLATRLKENASLVWMILQQGVERGELRPDLPVKLAGFFLLKTFMEVLDIVPQVSTWIVGVSGAEAVPLAQQAWFELYWRGVAADPTEPLPALPHD